VFAGFLQTLIRSEPFRVLQLVLGGLLMTVGPVIALPTPGPLGFFLFAVGLALVLRNSRWARRRYVTYSRRHPRVGRAVDIGLRRKRSAERRRRLIESGDRLAEDAATAAAALRNDPRPN